MPLLSLADEFADQFDWRDKFTEAAVEKLSELNLSLPEPSKNVTQSGTVAVIPVHGILIDRFCFAEVLGCATSYETIINSLTFCQQSGIRDVVFDMNSPGGYASGVLNLVQFINSLRQTGCRITAIVNSLCCSAAYRIACACDEIVAIPEAIVGSIGVNYILTDTHRQAAMRGTETVVISTSEYKWAGTPGTPVTEKQRENIRDNMVQPFFETFRREVQQSRGLSDKQLEAAADGRAFRAEQALDMNLIDRISTFADAMQSVGATQKQGVITMAKNEKPVEKTELEKPAVESIQTADAPEKTASAPAVVAATLDQLDESFPSASAEFKLEQLRQKATLDAAKDAYIRDLEERLKASQSAAASAVKPESQNQPEAPTASVSQTLTLPGSPALEKTDAAMPQLSQTEESASDQLKKIIDEKVKSGMSQSDAQMAALRENPELRQAWINGVNAR